MHVNSTALRPIQSGRTANLLFLILFNPLANIGKNLAICWRHCSCLRHCSCWRHYTVPGVSLVHDVYVYCCWSPCYCLRPLCCWRFCCCFCPCCCWRACYCWRSDVAGVLGVAGVLAVAKVPDDPGVTTAIIGSRPQPMGLSDIGLIKKLSVAQLCL